MCSPAVETERSRWVAFLWLETTAWTQIQSTVYKGYKAIVTLKLTDNSAACFVFSSIVIATFIRRSQSVHCELDIEKSTLSTLTYEKLMRFISK